VWAESHDDDGRGRLRFFAIDPAALQSGSTPSPDSSAALPPPAPASDPWKDCQSPDPETRLSGCTKVIEARGSDRIRLADAFDGRCAAYNQKQQFQPALSDCKSAIDLNPRYSYAYANLGAAYIGLNDTSSALSALNTAVTLKSNFLWSRLSRAKALESSGSNDEALKDYQYALLIDPLNQQARDGVARLMGPAAPFGTQGPENCAPDANEGVQQVALPGSEKGMEGAIATVASTIQIYQAKLGALTAKIGEFNREKDAGEQRQAAVAGSAEERKRTMNELQRLTDTARESRGRLDTVSLKIADMERKLAALDENSTGGRKEKREEIKDLRQQLSKLRSVRADAEREVHQKELERDAAESKARQKALQIAEAVTAVHQAIAARDAADSCATAIRANVEALDTKLQELRQTRDVELGKTLQTIATNLMSDLSEFAQRNSNLIPVPVGNQTRTYR
jgi:tetratricopeptide (TPR) repeat protein